MKSENNETVTLEELTSQQLKERLVGVTIGGFQNEEDPGNKVLIFTEYIRRALPNVSVVRLQPLETTAALNSVSAKVAIEREGKQEEVFVKVHIESGTQNLSALGVEGEYCNAKQLEETGWPVLAPLEGGSDPEYPLLVYPRVDAPMLFQLFEESYKSSNVSVMQDDVIIIERLNKQIGLATQSSLREANQQEAVNAPVQNLFLKRFEKDGRIDQWYTLDTEFQLPGVVKPVRWEELLQAQWVINGIVYSRSFKTIIREARNVLSLQGEDRVAVAMSHGDDHAGNIFVNRENKKGLVFDPAFAGLNPVSLCDLKAFAHTGFLPMAGLYYDPKLKTCHYQWDAQKNTMFVEVDFQKTPIFAVHETMARQIMNTRIVPLIKRAKEEYGIDSARERERLISGLVGCALLTINVSQLLRKNDRRGVGLLPMAIMFSELKGLPVLEEFDNRLKEIV